MSKLDELIKELCPNGVEYVTLEKVINIHKGVQFNKDNMAKEGTYPVINGGIEPSGYIEKFNEQENTITISQGGASAGYVNWQSSKFWAGAHCYVINPINDGELANRYLFHFIKNKEKELQQCQYGAGIPALGKSTIQSLQIPLPPLAVQREIVRILDKFTLYTQELAAELAARKKQYNFYRDKLLTCNLEIQQLELREIFDTKNGYTPSTSNKEYWSANDLPWFRMEDIREHGRVLNDAIQHISFSAVKGKPFPANSIIVSTSATIGEHALITCESLANQRFTYLILKDEYKSKYNIKFLFYYCYKLDEYCKECLNQGNFASVDMTKFNKFKFPLPPLDVQERIVNVLDNFDAICSDLKIGLPAEIEKRQKQYEFYREKLLTFDLASATIFTDRQTDRQTGLIRLFQYVFGFAYVRLGDIAGYSSQRVAAKSLNKDTYVGVDNLLPEKCGKQASAYVPKDGNCIVFNKEDILIGNIRPYLKKIWFADCNGGTNGDVLVIRTSLQIISAKYLFFVLSSDKFFAYDMQHSKGAKMPRGSKEAVMDYDFPLPPIEEQNRIVEILDRFDKLCNDLSSGLPAEIEKRQKQYEYYRDRLLKF